MKSRRRLLLALLLAVVTEELLRPLAGGWDSGVAVLVLIACIGVWAALLKLLAVLR